MHRLPKLAPALFGISLWVIAEALNILGGPHWLGLILLGLGCVGILTSGLWWLHEHEARSIDPRPAREVLASGRRIPDLRLALNVDVLPMVAEPVHVEYANKMAPGVAITRVESIWLRVDNKSTFDVEAVRLRLMSVEPPEAAFGLPIDLSWKEGERVVLTDILADGHASAVLSTRITLANGMFVMLTHLPFLTEPERPMRLNVEAWWEGQSLAAGSYWIKATSAPQPNRSARRRAAKQGKR